MTTFIKWLMFVCLFWGLTYLTHYLFSINQPIWACFIIGIIIVEAGYFKSH
jgi:mannose/fructose/N-acetylgalactosamine-specific phosphotransferase system component IIC